MSAAIHTYYGGPPMSATSRAARRWGSVTVVEGTKPPRILTDPFYWRRMQEDRQRACVTCGGKGTIKPRFADWDDWVECPDCRHMPPATFDPLEPPF